MAYIKRPRYLSKIEKFVDKPIIKILTGMRGVGKSTILLMIKDEILKEIPEKNKVYINCELLEDMNINDSRTFVDYLSQKSRGVSGKIYYFFNEIQIVEDWERVVNGLRVDKDCDIYVTGSNSNLISGELATLLAGRYVKFEIQPFCFSEFMQVFDNKNLTREEIFEEYIKFGGMPFLRYFDLEENGSYQYINDSFNTILVKDILKHNRVRDVEMLNRILLFVIQNSGSAFSANSIKTSFKREGISVSVDTILNYLEYCRRAFIFKKVPSFDVIENKYLKADEKYYLTNHALRRARGYSNIKDTERVLENIAYIELISRGYKVAIGKVKDKEIDFIATKNSERLYFQVSYLMETMETREREFGVYKHIEDNYPKFVLSMDKVDFSQDGISHMNLIDFLLKKDFY